MSEFLQFGKGMAELVLPNGLHRDPNSPVSSHLNLCLLQLLLQDAAGDLADTLAGLSMGEIRINKPAGPLKGVAAPAGVWVCL